MAGLAAENDSERVAAKEVLSELLVSDLRNAPAVDYDTDDVTRIIQDSVCEDTYNKIKNWTIAQLREWLLSYKANEETIKELRGGLTAEVIAGVTKLMSNLDLIYLNSQSNFQKRKETGI